MGWATDIASEFDIILYNGTKVVANENENPDLFWALHVGGGGFGVVTSLTQKVVQAPTPMDSYQ
jgi:FAD/FMN-containing dehydrogenase